MPQLTAENFTISIASVARSRELAQTLDMIADFPNIQVIIDGGDVKAYESVIHRFQNRVRFIINQQSLGVAAVWNQGIIQSSTRYVVLSSDHLNYHGDWFEPLLALMKQADTPLQVSLSKPMSFACFCIDKQLVALQGWFDHNFTRAYYEDEDWYLRFQERLGLHHTKIPYQEFIPKLETVARPPHKFTPGHLWNPIPNKAYFRWKWAQASEDDMMALYSREYVPYKRRLSEPDWPYMHQARRAYTNGNFGPQAWIYSPPRWEMRLFSWLASQRLIIWGRTLYLRKNSRLSVDNG